MLISDRPWLPTACFVVGGSLLAFGAFIWWCQLGPLHSVPPDQSAYQSSRGSFSFLVASGMFTSPMWQHTANCLLVAGGIITLTGAISYLRAMKKEN